MDGEVLLLYPSVLALCASSVETASMSYSVSAKIVERAAAFVLEKIA